MSALLLWPGRYQLGYRAGVSGFYLIFSTWGSNAAHPDLSSWSPVPTCSTFSLHLSINGISALPVAQAYMLGVGLAGPLCANLSGNPAGSPFTGSRVRPLLTISTAAPV